MVARNFPCLTPPATVGGGAQAPGAQQPRRSAPSQGVSFLPFGDLASGQALVAGAQPSGSAGPAGGDASAQPQ
eukprot:11171601-Lingulodinium_polyedra.AAC.1